MRNEYKQIDTHTDNEKQHEKDEDEEINTDSMKEQTTYKTNSYTYNSFSSSGNINIDYESESQTKIDSKLKTISNGNANNDETKKQFENDEKLKPIERTVVEHHTEPIDHIEVDQLYMDDGAATEEKTSPSTEDFHDDDDDVPNDDSVRLGMLRSRTFFPDDEDDDDDDDDRKGGERAEHSGAGGIDKYGDYENDNAQNRDRSSDRQYKHKNSFSSLDDKGKSHENDDFDRHPYQSSKADSKDAIKIISTPLGKVSIIYQSNTNNNSNTNTANNSNDSKMKLFDNSNQNSMNKFKNFFNHNMNAGAKQNASNSHRMIKNQHHRHNHHQHYHQQQQLSTSSSSSSPSSSLPVAAGVDSTSKSRPNPMNDKTKLLQKQITPVLTADGKVALLYRGAQDANNQHKIEVGKNLTDFTQSINSQESVINGKMNYNVVSETESKLPDGIPIDASVPTNANNQTEKIGIKNMEKLAVIVAAETTTTTTRTKLTTFAPVANTERPVLKLFKSDENTSRNTNEEENSILPNINRPPSEVLGIKKNQFTQFRITDMIATATPTLTSQDGTERTPLSYGNEVPKAIDSLNNEHDTHGQDGFGSSIDYDYNANRENGYHHHNPNHLETPSIDLPATSNHGGFDDSTTISDVLSKAEVVNLAIIPAFEGDLHRFHEQQQNDVSNDNNQYYNMMDRDENGNDIAVAGKQHKHRHHKIKDLSALHCAMQALVAIAALATVFGMLGAYFKQRILDQLTIMHW